MVGCQRKTPKIHKIFPLVDVDTYLFGNLPVASLACTEAALGHWAFDIDKSCVHRQVVADRVLSRLVPPWGEKLTLNVCPSLRR